MYGSLFTCLHSCATDLNVQFKLAENTFLMMLASFIGGWEGENACSCITFPGCLTVERVHCPHQLRKNWRLFAGTDSLMGLQLATF